MPGPILHAGAVALCPHGGSLNFAAPVPRVLVSGQPVAVISDPGPIAGCAFTVPGPKPQPCVTTRWMVGATRVTVLGQPVLINPSVGLCLSAEQIPGGPPQVVMSQLRVIAT
jgi:hypothetical protein